MSLDFNPKLYLQKIYQARDFIRKRLPKNFVPEVVLTLGSGGLGEAGKLIEPVCLPIPYEKIPGFKKPTVVGHCGNLIAGYISGRRNKVAVIGFQGRIHYYEEGDLKSVVFPVYVARSLGCRLYFATNACGGLNPKYKPGDLMIIKSHIDFFMPNPLLGPMIGFPGETRFPPQTSQYSPKLRKMLKKAAEKAGEFGYLHEGVYCAVTGPTYETSADCQFLRKIGASAVGMSTIPEIIIASSLGMETLGLSLITNVIAKDGTNATSHQEVMAAINDKKTKKRIFEILKGFFDLYQS
ncbi:MAG: purine-nucleoside phosphorylase [Microgenomates group bacterium]|nr:purine-nucleoside phosphorylase [Microgenomates group bacterium]